MFYYYLRHWCICVLIKLLLLSLNKNIATSVNCPRVNMRKGISTRDGSSLEWGVLDICSQIEMANKCSDWVCPTDLNYYFYQCKLIQRWWWPQVNLTRQRRYATICRWRVVDRDLENGKGCSIRNFGGRWLTNSFGQNTRLPLRNRLMWMSIRWFILYSSKWRKRLITMV